MNGIVLIYVVYVLKQIENYTVSSSSWAVHKLKTAIIIQMKKSLFYHKRLHKPFSIPDQKHCDYSLASIMLS